MTTGVETDRNKIKTYLHTCVQTYLERIISLVTFHLIDVKVKILFFILWEQSEVFVSNIYELNC